MGDFLTLTLTQCGTVQYSTRHNTACNLFISYHIISYSALALARELLAVTLSLTMWAVGWVLSGRYICLSVCLCEGLSVGLTAYLTDDCLSACLLVCLSVSLSVYLPVCLSVSLPSRHTGIYRCVSVDSTIPARSVLEPLEDPPPVLCMYSRSHTVDNNHD